MVPNSTVALLFTLSSFINPVLGARAFLKDSGRTQVTLKANSATTLMRVVHCPGIVIRKSRKPDSSPTGENKLCKHEFEVQNKQTNPVDGITSYELVKGKGYVFDKKEKDGEILLTPSITGDRKTDTCVNKGDKWNKSECKNRQLGNRCKEDSTKENCCATCFGWAYKKEKETCYDDDDCKGRDYKCDHQIGGEKKCIHHAPPTLKTYEELNPKKAKKEEKEKEETNEVERLFSYDESTGTSHPYGESRAILQAPPEEEEKPRTSPGSHLGIN